MPLKEQEIAEIRSLVVQAGALAGEYFKTTYKIEEKGGGMGPVTEADHAVDRFLIERLQRLFPNDTLISEEGNHHAPAGSERVWYVDPIDGTRDFIRGEGGWAVMLGLLEGGQPQFGLVLQPTTGTLYYAQKGQGAWILEKGQPQIMRVRNVQSSAEAVLVRSKSHPSHRVDALQQKLGITRTYPQGSVGLKLAHIAQGRADLYFNLSGQCQYWDLIGPVVILSEAGGGIASIADGADIHFPLNEVQVRTPYFAWGSSFLRDAVSRIKMTPGLRSPDS